MNRSTAIRHLVEMATEASNLLRLRETDIGWPLDELWLTGSLLETEGDLDAGSVILLIDVLADELPWLAKHPTAEWVGDRLRLGKRPMLWCYRPSVWPPWNARHRRWRASGRPRPGSTKRLSRRCALVQMSQWSSPATMSFGPSSPRNARCRTPICVESSTRTGVAAPSPRRASRGSLVASGCRSGRDR